MTMILPENISERISAFLCHKQNFPFIHSNELTCIFFLYGRKWKVNGENEYKQAIDLADQTYRKISKDIEAYRNRDSKMDLLTDFARSNYINRGLQIMVENKNNNNIVIPMPPTTNPGYPTSLFFVTSDVPANPAPTINRIVTSSYVIMMFLKPWKYPLEFFHIPFVLFVL